MPEDKVRVSGRSPAKWQKKVALNLWNDVSLPTEFQVSFTEIKIEYVEIDNPANVGDKIGQRRYKKKRVVDLSKGYRITFVIEEENGSDSAS